MASNKDLRLLRTVVNVILDADTEARSGFMKAYETSLIAEANTRLTKSADNRYALPEVNWDTWLQEFPIEIIATGRRNKSDVRLFHVSVENDAIALVKDTRETTRTLLYVIEKQTVNGKAKYTLKAKSLFTDSKNKKQAYIDIGIDAVKLSSIPEAFLDESAFDQWLSKHDTVITYELPKEESKP